MLQTISKNAVILGTIPGLYVPTNLIIREIANSPEKIPQKTVTHKMVSKNEKDIHIMGRSTSSIPCVVQSKRKGVFADKLAGSLQRR